jgi:hypothetical protein
MPLRESINYDLISDCINLPPEVERTLTVGLEDIVGRFCGWSFRRCILASNSLGFCREQLYSRLLHNNTKHTTIYIFRLRLQRRSISYGIKSRAFQSTVTASSVPEAPNPTTPRPKVQFRDAHCLVEFLECHSYSMLHSSNTNRLSAPNRAAY